MAVDFQSEEMGGFGCLVHDGMSCLGAAGGYSCSTHLAPGGASACHVARGSWGGTASGGGLLVVVFVVVVHVSCSGEIWELKFAQSDIPRPGCQMGLFSGAEYRLGVVCLEWSDVGNVCFGMALLGERSPSLLGGAPIGIPISSGGIWLRSLGGI